MELVELLDGARWMEGARRNFASSPHFHTSVKVAPSFKWHTIVSTLLWCRKSKITWT